VSVFERILDCYRLGKYYGVDPSIFLAKPLGELDRHVMWTDRLIERANIEAAADNDGR
jgi:hypothetical protein